MPKAKTGKWGTPLWLYDSLDAEFHFTVDAAASHDLHKHERYWTREEDGLKQSWKGERVFVNPPFFANPLAAFARKAFMESRDINTMVAMVVPVKSDQGWWCDYALRAQRRFLRGRIKFQGAEHAYPKPVAVLVFGRWIDPSARFFTLPPLDRRPI